MEDTILYTALFLLFLILIFKLFKLNSNQKNLPPSPPSLPIIGHLHMITSPRHRCFQKFSQKYGPIISLKFGSRLVVIVSSAPAVEECFSKNDIVLADRPQLLTGKHMSYNYLTIPSAPYGDHWRNVRRIGSVEIFSNHRLNTFLSIRKDEVNHLIHNLSRNSRQGFAKVELKSAFQDLTFNVIMRMVAGKRYYGERVTEDEEEAREFKDLIAEIFKYGGTSNPEDFLPVLNWVTGGSYERKVKRIAKRSDKFMQKLIDEHRYKKSGLESMNTMIDHLLSLQETEPSYYSDEMIKALILTLLLAGTDTSAATLEWAMSNLVNNPDVLEKAKIELDSQIGQEHLMEESDSSKLPYLHNIISETLRLCSAAPLLVPHMASNDCTIGGYNVPRNTIVLINAWAIHRDPTVWDNPLSFKPERFENEQHEGHKLLPFGLGRRACPGAGLAQRVVGLALGSLIQCFEWKRIDDKLVDMTEGEGLTMPKLEPLQVLCKARGIVDKVSF